MGQLTSFIFIVWIIFWVCWVVAAFSSKKNTTFNSGRNAIIRIPTVLIFIVIIELARNISGITYSNLVIHIQVIRSMGLIIFLAGLGLAAWARLYLGKNWGMPMSQKEKPELVTSGPYRYIRHPIYTGIIFALAGTALAVSLVWLLAVVFAAFNFIYSALQEEKYMTKQFPKQYDRYKRTSKMLIPYIY